MQKHGTGVDIDTDGGAGAVRVLRHDAHAVGQRGHAGLGAHKLGRGPASAMDKNSVLVPRWTLM